MVMSRFTAGKTPDIKPVQVLIKIESALGTRNKIALCVIMHICPGIKNANIGKESI